jgi:hypothetical protein
MPKNCYPRKGPMKLRTLIPLISVFALCGLAAAQDPKPQVLADGDPPLTQEMANDYMHFMQWSLRTPLTLGQEERIQSFLVDNWKAANLAEIKRTLNILALRKRLQTMGLTDSKWAAYQMGRDALHNWNASQNMEMARWGLALYNSSHRALVKGDPPLTRQMEDAYEELGYFMMNVVDGSQPAKIDAVERTQLADSIATTYAQLTPEQKANFADLPKVWVQIRNAWPTLDDATKSALKDLWKSNFGWLLKVPPVTKGAKPAPVTPPSSRPQPTINRLVRMTWVTTPDIFSKMSAVGTPYGLGW